MKSSVSEKQICVRQSNNEGGNKTKTKTVHSPFQKSGLDLLTVATVTQDVDQSCCNPCIT